MSEIIVQISDLHFGTAVPSVVEALTNKINEINPDVLVVSGDITQRSFGYQFKEAQCFLERLKCSNKIIVPGNHDIPFYKFWHRFYKPEKNFLKYMQEYGCYSYVSDAIAVLGLNSCNPKHYKNGCFTNSHAKLMTQFFSRVPKTAKRVLVCHHPVDVILEEDLENLMPQSFKAVEHFQTLNIDVVMAGHIHFPFCRNLKERYPWLVNNIWVCQAGTATSYRVRSAMPNSFMVFETQNNDKNMVVHQWDFNDVLSDFMKKKSFPLFN